MSVTAYQGTQEEVKPAVADRSQSRIEQRVERERLMVRAVMSKTRAELEAACLEAGASVDGLSDEALRSTLFQLYRGGPAPQPKML
jgi:hypothetical protein